MEEKAKLKVDSGMMFCAISNASETSGGPQERGFLNRKTGEICFIPESELEADCWYDTNIAVDMVFDRAHIETSPEDWVEIPKYNSRLGGPRGEDESEDGFIQRFLEEHGIEAELK